MTNTKSCESKGEQEEVKSREKTEMEEEGTWETEGMRGEREGQESSGSGEEGKTVWGTSGSGRSRSGLWAGALT